MPDNKENEITILLSPVVGKTQKKWVFEVFIQTQSNLAP